MFMTFMTGQQVITIHMLSKITKSKDNQAMKFGQLIKGKMIYIYIYFENSYKKCGGEASHRLFYKYSKLRASLNQLSEIL